MTIPCPIAKKNSKKLSAFQTFKILSNKEY